MSARDICQSLHISSTTLWRWRQQKIFPLPISLGPKLIGWRQSVVEEWIEKQEAAQAKLTKSECRNGGAK